MCVGRWSMGASPEASNSSSPLARKAPSRTPPTAVRAQPARRWAHSSKTLPHSKMSSNTSSSDNAHIGNAAATTCWPALPLRSSLRDAPPGSHARAPDLSPWPPCDPRAPMLSDQGERPMTLSRSGGEGAQTKIGWRGIDSKCRRPASLPSARHDVRSHPFVQCSPATPSGGMRPMASGNRLWVGRSSGACSQATDGCQETSATCGAKSIAPTRPCKPRLVQLNAWPTGWFPSRYSDLGPIRLFPCRRSLSSSCRPSIRYCFSRTTTFHRSG